MNRPPLGAQLPPELFPVDYVAGVLYTYDGDYCYGLEASGTPSQVWRYDPETHSGEVVHDFGGTTGFSLCQALSSGTLLACVGNNAALSTSAQTWTLYRSTDQGVSWTSVLAIGTPDGGGSQVVGVTLQNPRSIAEVAVGGQSALILCEYNTNGSRTNGSTNDEVKALISYNDGQTWETLVKWNTDGATNNLTHCHQVYGDPLSGRVYFLMGDPDDKCGIIEWDPAATGGAWTAGNNKTWAQMAATSGYACRYGEERYRATEIVRRPQDGRLYWIADTGDTEDSGIYRASTGLVDVDKLVGSGLVPTNHNGYYSAVFSNGQMVMTSGPSSASTNFAVFVYASCDGTHWRCVARHNLSRDVASGAPSAVFLVDEQLYISATNSVRKRGQSTSISEINGYFVDERPKSIHPVYWVATDGVNATINESGSKGGWTPRNPLADPRYPLISSAGRVSHGARIIVAAGTYSTDRAYLDWQNQGAAARDGETGEPVVVTGAGRAVTVWQHNIGDANTSLAYTTYNDHNIEFEAIWLKDGKTSSTTLSYDTGTGMSVVLRDAAIGLPTGGQGSGLGHLRPSTLMPVTAIRSAILATPGASNEFGVFFRDNSAVFKAYACVFYGGVRNIAHTRSTLTVLLENCAFLGYTQGGYYLSAGSGPPSIRNCVFNGAGNSIADLVGLTWTGLLRKISYAEAASGANLLAELAASTNYTSDDLLVFDSSALELTVPTTSPLLGVGGKPAVTIGYDRLPLDTALGPQEVEATFPMGTRPLVLP